jgi:chromosome segregation ATPase
LKEENQKIMENVENLKADRKILEAKVEATENQVEHLKAKNEILEAKLGDLTLAFNQLEQKFVDIAAKV